jgi:hypothetical protein
MMLQLGADEVSVGVCVGVDVSGEGAIPMMIHPQRFYGQICDA